MQLNTNNLNILPEKIRRPSYDRNALSAGIVHIGVGHFHRAHQALYIDDLLSRGLAHDWAITGMGIAPGGGALGETLRAQDFLYTLTEKGPTGENASRVIGSLIEYVYAEDNLDAAIASLARPETRVITLTITEGGYDVDDSTGQFRPASPPVLADLKTDSSPRSVFGVVMEAMRVRRDMGRGGLTIVSCDNIEGNGSVARAAFIGFAERKDAELASWMKENITFPSSMVDRVTPRTTGDDRLYLESQGIEDAWPVTSEPFRQWVLEDSFIAGRPPLEAVGVEMVSDVLPYELMKLRLANGVHQALAYFGVLRGHSFVHEAIADPAINRMLLRYIDEEAAPTLPPIPGYDFGSYGRTVLERFGNPQIRDGLDRICQDASDRIPKFLLPVVVQNVREGRNVDVCAAVVASWARYAEGTGENGETIVVDDPLAETLKTSAAEQRERPLSFLENRELFADLIETRAFTEPYLRALEILHEHGVEALLETLSE